MTDFAKGEDDPRLSNAAVDRSMTTLEALADEWGVEVDLPAMVRALVAPMRLNRSVPNNIRESFIARAERNIDAFIKQAWIEGAYRGSADAFDAVRAGYDPNTRSTDGELDGEKK